MSPYIIVIAALLALLTLAGIYLYLSQPSTITVPAGTPPTTDQIAANAVLQKTLDDNVAALQAELDKANTLAAQVDAKVAANPSPSQDILDLQNQVHSEITDIETQLANAKMAALQAAKAIGNSSFALTPATVVQTFRNNKRRERMANEIVSDATHATADTANTLSAQVASASTIQAAVAPVDAPKIETDIKSVEGQANSNANDKDNVVNTNASDKITKMLPADKQKEIEDRKEEHEQEQEDRKKRNKDIARNKHDEDEKEKNQKNPRRAELLALAAQHSRIKPSQDNAPTDPTATPPPIVMDPKAVAQEKQVESVPVELHSSDVKKRKDAANQVLNASKNNKMTAANKRAAAQAKRDKIAGERDQQKVLRLQAEADAAEAQAAYYDALANDQEASAKKSQSELADPTIIQPPAVTPTEAVATLQSSVDASSVALEQAKATGTNVAVLSDAVNALA